MKVKSIHSYFLTLICLFLTCLNAWSLDFTNLYFVGDSLTDLGNRTDELLCLNGPCTNPPGFTWAHYLGENLGKSVTKSNAGGTDYAYIGAPTSPNSTFTDPNLTTNGQVMRIIADQGGSLDPNALYNIWAGADNFLDLLLIPPLLPPVDQRIAQLPSVAMISPMKLIYSMLQVGSI